MIMKMHIFQEFLIMKILSQVCNSCHFIMILSNHNKIPSISKNLRENP